MAGWAWIHGRNLVPWNERVRMDVWYVDNWSLRLDAYILAKAFVLLFQRRGVYGPGEQGAGSGSQRARSKGQRGKGLSNCGLRI